MAMFVKYDGIDGESNDDHHGKWIDVLSMDWGAQAPGSNSDGGGRRRGNALVDDMVFIIEYGKASPKLQETCLTGAVIPKVELELTATYGGTRKTYLGYELKNVLVTSFQTDASGNDEAGPPAMVLSNTFEEIKVTYTEFDASGTASGNVEMKYKNKKK